MRAGRWMICSILVCPLQAMAQAPVLSSGAIAPGQIEIRVGIDPAVVVSLGYSHRVTAVDDPRAARLGAEIEVPTTVFSHGAWRASLVSSIGWTASGHWGVRGTARWYVAHNRNRAGAMTGVGVAFRGRPGWYGHRSGVALDLGWQSTLATYIQNSAAVDSTFTQRHRDAALSRGPRDGWYGSTANRFRIGLTGSHGVGHDIDLSLSIGSVFALQKQGVLVGFDLGQVPFYLETSASIGVR